jgi:hypothetical protein
MAGFEMSDIAQRRLNAAIAVACFVAVVGVARWLEATERRWWERSRPIPRAWTLVGRMRTAYLGKRANVAEVSDIFRSFRPSRTRRIGAATR